MTALQPCRAASEWRRGGCHGGELPCRLHLQAASPPVLPGWNEGPTRAPPLGSISRPLCGQSRQQITFAWIVRLIIISRWQPVHYNAGPKRLTLFQIKIYNANTCLGVFAQLECIHLLGDLLMCTLLAHEWHSRRAFPRERLAFIPAD